MKRNSNGSNSASENEAKFLRLCQISEPEAFLELETQPKGLTEEQSCERQKRFGANSLADEEKSSLWRDLYDRVKDPLVIQLIVIAFVSLLMGDVRAASVVGGMLFLSVVLSYIQERRSSRAASNLKKLVQASAIVFRDGKESEIPISQIVPGDVVVFAAGSIVPADCRIISAKDCFASQSALTGESIPVEKFAVVDPLKKSVLEVQNACFQGSTIVSGSARALVVHTGARTFLGAISKQLERPKETTDFDRGVASFVWLMVRFMIVMVSLTFLIVGLTKGDWVQALLFGLSIAVGLTPEMLPMIMTVSLSKGALSMSKKKVIVKKLKSLQNLGAIDVLCTDKTGTLTQDRVILEKHVDVTNRASEDVLRYAYMNSYYQTGLRNLLDLSLLSHEDLDVEKSCRKVDEIPFDFQRKRMSVVIDYEDSHVLICKGSVEAIFAGCTQYQIDDEIFPLIDIIKNDVMEEYQRLSSDGYRVLAVAYREFPRTQETFSVADESNLVLLGYLAFFDPPKDSTEKALRSLKEQGVQVKILTGDNELVTKKVCSQVGISVDRVITGSELSGLSAQDFDLKINQFDVFAHLTPDQKDAIIRSLRAQGRVVGYMGDGINDAPAMKAADVGISVDTAVDVAKESADIILLEKNLLILEDGIVEGRKLFNNISKYIKMGASSNFGNMFSVLGASLFLPFLPMSPLLILVNNFLYDFSQTGIPSDHVDPEFQKTPQKWDIDILRRFMFFIGPISSLFDYATFFLMLYFFNCIAFNTASGAANQTYWVQLFQTGWFVESLLTQTLIVHIIRTNRIPFFQSSASLPMMLSTLAIMALAVYLPYSPIAGSLGMVPLPATYWFWIVGFLIAYSVLTHTVKTWFYKHYASIDKWLNRWKFGRAKGRAK